MIKLPKITLIIYLFISQSSDLFILKDMIKLCVLIFFSTDKYHQCSTFLNLDFKMHGIIWIILVSITLERARIENPTHGLRTEVSTGKVTMLREVEAKHHHQFFQLFRTQSEIKSKPTLLIHTKAVGRVNMIIFSL